MCVCACAIFCVVSQHPNHYTTRPLLLCSLINWLVIRRCLRNLNKKTDLFKDTGAVDAIADTVDKFQEAHAERPQRTVFHHRWVVKIKVDEDCLCQWVTLQPRCLHEHAFYFNLGGGQSTAISKYVCLSVCLCTTHPNFLNLLYTLPVAVAWLSSEDNAISLHFQSSSFVNTTMFAYNGYS